MKQILYFVIALSIVAMSCTIKKNNSIEECATVDAAVLVDSLGLDSIQVDTIIVNE